MDVVDYTLFGPCGVGNRLFLISNRDYCVCWAGGALRYRLANGDGDWPQRLLTCDPMWQKSFGGEDCAIYAS